jgi:hypothetical protein
MSHRIELIPQEHMGLCRVDVDVRGFVGSIGVHKHRGEEVEDERATKEAAPNRAEACREPAHVRKISYNVQVSVLFTFHSFLIVNYRVYVASSRASPKSTGDYVAST